MADKPILFSGPMVRALLDGTKTQTRRVIKPRSHASLFDGSWADSYVLDPGNKDWRESELRFAVGDRLWVRETWSARMVHGWTIADARSGMYQTELIYQADGDKSIDGWWPSIHMPREFSRLTLMVTDVRVERLQDISEADAIAEGVVKGFATFDYDEGGIEKDWFTVPGIDDPGTGVSAADMYAQLWNIINGDGAWESNPWVAAYTFTVVRGNIDQLSESTP